MYIKLGLLDNTLCITLCVLMFGRYFLIKNVYIKEKSLNVHVLHVCTMYMYYGGVSFTMSIVHDYIHVHVYTYM